MEATESRPGAARSKPGQHLRKRARPSSERVQSLGHLGRLGGLGVRVWGV